MHACMKRDATKATRVMYWGDLKGSTLDLYVWQTFIEAGKFTIILFGGLVIDDCCLLCGLIVSQVAIMSIDSNHDSPFADALTILNPFIGAITTLAFANILHILCLCSQSQIISLIIETIEVSVVYFLMWEQWSAKFAFKDKTMEKQRVTCSSQAVYLQVMTPSIPIPIMPLHLSQVGINIIDEGNLALSERNRNHVLVPFLDAFLSVCCQGEKALTFSGWEATPSLDNMSSIAFFFC